MVRRVPLLVAFGEFAWARGARAVGDLPAFVEGFVVERIAGRADRGVGDRWLVNEVRGPVEQMLSVVVFWGSGQRARPQRGVPFSDVLPGFFEYLACERGLRP